MAALGDVNWNSEYFKLTGADTARLIIGSANITDVSTICVVMQATTPVGVVAVAQARSMVNEANAATWLPWIYRSAYLNGAAVATFALSVANVTDSSILHIPAAGLQIAINVTGHTSGTLEFFVKRLIGPSVI